MDGGSQDQTVETIQDITKGDSRVRIFSGKDRGIYDAMNKGIKCAEGRWLYFLGSDDCLTGSNILSQVAMELSDESCHLLYGNVWMNKRVYDGVFSMDKLLRKNISHQGIFYRADVFEIVGNYRIDFRLHADWDFNIRCFLEHQLVVRYVSIVIASFAQGGVSSAHDQPFLRESLLPHKLTRFREGGPGFGSLPEFDQWWRLIRNAGIRSVDEIEIPTSEQRCPPILLRIITFQSFLPLSLLKFGPASKILMLCSYLFSRAIFARK